MTAGAALVGTRGLQAQGNNTNYVQYNFGTAAQPAWPTYDARFYFRPNGNTSTGKDILAAATSNTFGTTLFHVRYRLSARHAAGPDPGRRDRQRHVDQRPRRCVNNVIEVVWQSGTHLRLYVNGALSQTLTAGAGSVGAVRLGSVTATGNATAHVLRRLRLQANGVAARRAVSVVTSIDRSDRDRSLAAAVPETEGPVPAPLEPAGATRASLAVASHVARRDRRGPRPAGRRGGRPDALRVRVRRTSRQCRGGSCRVGRRHGAGVRHQGHPRRGHRGRRSRRSPVHRRRQGQGRRTSSTTRRACPSSTSSHRAPCSRPAGRRPTR